MRAIAFTLLVVSSSVAAAVDKTAKEPVELSAARVIYERKAAAAKAE